ncbi:hypothetical protein B0H13DRAFT_2012283 [Mycena leptocephala]|nr:hypothetical protein B0H13DRAFT_2012283 [Mycena leptocephala]
MSLRSALRSLHTHPPNRVQALQFEFTPPSSSPLPTGPADYIALFRALGHRKFTEKYRPNPAPVALARRGAAIGTPRQVYAETLSQMGLVRTPTKPVTTSSALVTADPGQKAALLTAALRTFVRLEDYAAALVVLRALNSLPKKTLSHARRTKATNGALQPLACKIYFERNAPRQRLTRALLGGRPLTGWLVEQMIEANTPAETAAGLEERPAPLALILRRALSIHGGAPTVKKIVPWRDEEARVEKEMNKPRRLRKERGKGFRLEI